MRGRFMVSDTLGHPAAKRSEFGSPAAPWKGTLGLPAPKCRWCSKFGPPAAPKGTLGLPVQKRQWCSQFAPTSAPRKVSLWGFVPKAPVVFKICLRQPQSAGGARNLVRLRHQGMARWAFRPKAPMAFRIWSACGAEEGHLAPSGSKGPAEFKIWSACGAKKRHLWAFRSQRAGGIRTWRFFRH